MHNMMKAVLIDGITRAQDVRLTQTRVPDVKQGWVLVKVKAFGLNHSEKVLRLSEIKAEYIRKPIIPGIECVGEIMDPSDSGWRVGQKVVALMGGMGRSFNGSYAEYALLPTAHVFPVETDLDWETLAATPETWFTAWGALFESLRLTQSDTLLVRGATCSLGYAAITIAKTVGARVVATTHRAEKLPLLCEADERTVDSGTLAGTLRGITKALDLTGPKVLRDTLFTVDKGGVVCNVGILGGVYTLDQFDPIKEIPNGVYLTGFFSNYPDAKTVASIFEFIAYNRLKPKVGAVFSFEHIAEAVAAQDLGKVNGKIVVKMDS